MPTITLDCKALIPTNAFGNWKALCLGMVLLASHSHLSTARAQTAPRTWPYETSFGYFEVHSDFPIRNREVLERTLQHLHSDLTTVLQLPNNQESVHIVLFESDSEYTRYMQHYFPSIAKRRAIYLQDRGPGMLFTSWHEDIETDLRHEAAHALLNRYGAQLPLWLDEGLAEYFEVPRESRFRNSHHREDVAARAQQGLVPSLLELEKGNDLAAFTDDHYRDSWAWVHFLLHRRPQTRELLIEFLKRARNRSPQLPLSRQLTQIVEDLNIEFQSHFKDLSEPET